MRGTGADFQEKIADWAVALAFEHIPATVVEKTKLQILSVLASVGASEHCNGRRMFDGLDPLMRDAALSMWLDYDDYLFIGHTGHSSVLPSWQIARERGADGRSMLTAIVAANEVAARLGAACFLGPLNGQMASFIHPAASCVAAGSLLKLDTMQMRDALGIALAFPDYPTEEGFFEGDSKALTAAFSISKGVAAARMAANGARGSRQFLTKNSGFFRLFSFKPLLMMLEGLSETWLTETLTYKKYPACAYFEPALEAASRLPRVDPAEIAAVTVRTNLLTHAVDSKSRPDPDVPTTLPFSLRALVAIVLLEGKLGPGQVDDAAPAERKDAFHAMFERTGVVHDPSLTRKMKDHFLRFLPPGKILPLFSIRDVLAIRGHLKAAYPGTHGFTDFKLARQFIGTRLRSSSWTIREFPARDWTMCFPSAVEVVLRNGRRYSECCDIPPGASNNPRARALVEGKLRASVADGDSLRDKILNLETLKSRELHEIMQRFRGAIPDRPAIPARV